jgi:cysteinyl-tRNA synthetase
MSKSLGNFFTLRDLLQRGIDPLAIRYVLLSTHYRQPNNFSFDAVHAAENALQRIRDFRRRLSEVDRTQGDDLSARAEECERGFVEEMDDDLNISGALGHVFQFIRDVNKMLDEYAVSREGAQRALALLDRLNAVTGVFAPPQDDTVPQEILALVGARQAARKVKDFQKADALRAQLTAAGWQVEDTPTGPRVKRL